MLGAIDVRLSTVEYFAFVFFIYIFIKRWKQVNKSMGIGVVGCL